MDSNSTFFNKNRSRLLGSFNKIRLDIQKLRTEEMQKARYFYIKVLQELDDSIGDMILLLTRETDQDFSKECNALILKACNIIDVVKEDVRRED